MHSGVRSLYLRVELTCQFYLIAGSDLRSGLMVGSCSVLVVEIGVHNAGFGAHHKVPHQLVWLKFHDISWRAG